AGVPGGAYREIYDRVTLASPASLVALPGLPLDARGTYVTAGEYLAYLRRYADHAGLEVERADVRSIGRARDQPGSAAPSGDGDGGFVVDSGARPWRARFVVVATGMWGSPVLPLIEGLDSCGVPLLHAREWRGPGALGAGADTLLIIGGATSAVEIAEEAATAGLAVTVSVRGRLHVARQSFLGRDVHHWIGPVARLPSWIAPGHCADRPTLPGTDRG